MRTTLLTVPIDALAVARITCRRSGCGGVVEVPLDKIYRVANAKCPLCGEGFNPTNEDPGRLTKLRDAIRAVAELRPFFAVEFVAPDVEEKV